MNAKQIREALKPDDGAAIDYKYAHTVMAARFADSSASPDVHVRIEARGLEKIVQAIECRLTAGITTSVAEPGDVPSYDKLIDAMNVDGALLDEQISTLWKVLAPLQEKRQKLRESTRVMCDERDLIVYSVTPPGDDDLAFVLLGSDSHTSGVANARADAMALKLGLYRSGVWPNGQAALKIMLNEDGSNFDLTLTSIRALLPHMKPMTLRGKPVNELERFVLGKRMFDIFDHRLGAGGNSFDLVVYDGERCAVIGTYSGTRDFKTLVEGLRYVQANHWYKQSAEEE